MSTVHKREDPDEQVWRYLDGGDTTSLSTEAAEIVRQLRLHFPGGINTDQQILCIAEEVGELVGAYRRATNRARRNGEWSEVYYELADVIITAYVLANILNVDIDEYIHSKLDCIYSRGWKEDNE